jgi:hypothetical protein
MKFFDFGVEFFWVYQSGYGASVLLMKKTCHSGVKKVFFQKNPQFSFFRFSILGL